MTSLDRNLRRDLENAVKKARRVAEAGARDAINQLAVGHHEPWPTLSPEQRKLRNRLRAHGRQLGDRLDERKGTQSIERLTSECAYEHWHRLLFARFLAENDLLVEPESGMALSLDECRELAREHGRDWLVLASDFAQRMLPQVFRIGDPLLDVSLPPEKRQELESIVEAQPRAVFTASDSLGWCYQFWQSELRDEVNDAGNKIGAEELPAVTQLFTEDYMVDFLLDNTLGAWYASKVIAANPSIAEAAQSEDELRQVVALPGCGWEYLRLERSHDGKWTAAAGAFGGWPKSARSLRCIDPCMGSGHFVVAMFERLVALRIAEEGLDESAAVATVIRDNLFGLELDARCTQIGAFNLALAAWRRVGHCALPVMNLACSGLVPNTREADWLAIAGDNQRLQSGMDRLYRSFQKAAVLGSLINPRVTESDLIEAAFHELQPLLESALAREAKSDAAYEMAVTARGLARAAEILVGQFTLVATNVPYLGRGKQDDVLLDFCEQHYSRAKADLATCFVERCVQFCASNGTTALVTPQNWWFLGSYREVRANLLARQCLDIAATLGEEAWQSFGDRGPSAVLMVVTNTPPTPETRMAAIHASPRSTIAEKMAELKSGELRRVLQAQQLKSKDHLITVTEPVSGTLLGSFATCVQGVGSTDLPRFIQFFWEHAAVSVDWDFYQKAPTGEDFSNLCGILFWQQGRGDLAKIGTARKGLSAYQKRGVAVAVTRHLTVSHFLGNRFDCTLAVILPKRDEHARAIAAFLFSPEFREQVRKVDQAVSVTESSFVKVPFDLERWQRIAEEKFPHGLPAPFSSDPTQWLFNGHPAGSDQPLHVAVARLLGYRWPRQTGWSFPDCPSLPPDELNGIADEDGIVCLPAVKGEAGAAERLREVLAAAYAKDWGASKLDALLTQAGAYGRSLDEWLRDMFFEQHCEIFKQRPFIWHVWDGQRNGFSALVNAHALCHPNGRGRRVLERLIYTYLGEWLDRQRGDQKAGIEGADSRVAASEHLKRELEKILEGQPPYDIFARWKPLYEQPIGWEPDPNDGIRVNIRPFMTARPLGARGKNACILRVSPKIKWEKNGGKEPLRPKADYPWFWGWEGHPNDFLGGAEFDGNRWNDLHYSRSVKLAARERAKGGRS